MDRDYETAADIFCKGLRELATNKDGVYAALAYLSQEGLGLVMEKGAWKAEGQIGGQRARFLVEQTTVPASDVVDPKFLISARGRNVERVAVYGQIGSIPIQKAWPVRNPELEQACGTNLGTIVQGCWSP